MILLPIPSWRFGLVVLVVLLSLGRAPEAAEPEKAAPPSPEAMRFFESKVRPLLVENCYKCHGPDKQKGELRVDSRTALLEGGDQGPAIVPGQPDKSLLVKAVRHESADLKMPPSKKLTREQIDDLAKWVQMGAPWPGGDAPVVTRKSEKPITDKDRAHWAFQPIRRPAVPAIRNPAFPIRNPIDAFILARLEAKGLTPNPPATPRELVRRLYYDLTGLPPTPEEVEAFVNDPSPEAYEKLVDRLLASPQHGEKWARHWLDLVRFAETNSYERDNPKPNAWRYRDYVIRAFNEDRPYDRFIREQLAGDELGTTDGFIATGYYRLGIWDDEPTDRELARFDGLDDIVATTGQVFLGLTLDCARCHDHKIDPIPQKDYYRLLAFFNNINHYRNGGPTDEVPLFTDTASKEAYEARVRALEQRRGELQAAVTTFEDEFRKLYQQVHGQELTGPDVPKLARTDGAKLLGKERYDRYAEQRRELLELQKQKVAAEMALCVTERGSQAPDTFVLLRGNPHVKGEKVQPGFPQVLGVPDPVLPTPPPGAKTSGRRLVLANWIASPDNPLTARVMVNRLWQHHFGRGIVRSPNNFGLQGDRPTHPELLDWLAAEFINPASGGKSSAWSMKHMHRLIVTSSAYRLSSRGNPTALAADPINDLFWRFDMRRLTAEEIRDTILAVSGVLNPKMYGPSIYVDIPREVLAGQSMPGKGWGKSPPEEQNRRSIYIHVKRSLLTPILEVFDLAETDRSSPVRFTTTQPTQALAMLNSDFLNQQAGVLAQRLRREAGDDVSRQVRRALQLTLVRPPSEAEVRRGVHLIARLRGEPGTSPEVALKNFCLMVLNLNEFVYLD
jgi:mono/diheme cytochrome c family protein